MTGTDVVGRVSTVDVESGGAWVVAVVDDVSSGVVVVVGAVVVSFGRPVLDSVTVTVPFCVLSLPSK